ncbi:MAG: Methionine aminopeptidase [Parcubacteria group bacterium GW2011_GWB1_43_8]|nr:MAG: Methionine aminopeptidase [Parcubacteria group bacterium GW2011_GWB1_43_8]
MTILKNIEDINKLREGGKIIASVLREVTSRILPGVKTIELDKLAEKMIREAGGRPSFKNYKTLDDKFPYPASLCVSVNEEVVHGVPGERVLKDGDIVSLDLGMEYKGFYTDSAVTVSVGNTSEQAKKLIETTKKSLNLGVMAVKAGAFTGDVGYAVQSFAEKNGFNVVRKLVGHGLGRKVHEPPEIPNFGVKGKGEILKEGEVIAIEPMITAGRHDIYLDKDWWTWKTKDGSLSAHFEHTIIVTKTGAEIITKI